MNDSAAPDWRAQLLALRDALTQEHARGQEGTTTVALDQQSVGRLSRMDALQSQAMANASQQRRGARQRAVAAALHRLDAGEFGYCTDCGEAIGEARLAFDPTVALCIACARG